MTRLLFASIVTLGLSACAVLTPATPEEIVMKRSEKRLEALQKNDIKKAYGFMSPGYRATTGLRFFEADHVGLTMAKGHEVVSVTCEEERCRVGMNVRFNMADIGGMMGMRGQQAPSGETEMYFQETWIYIDGQWWAAER